LRWREPRAKRFSQVTSRLTSPLCAALGRLLGPRSRRPHPRHRRPARSVAEVA
jgi:hypothetical protein